MTDGSLQGLTVIEYGEGITAAYCGKLLADLGAQVIKIEPPRRGDRARWYGPFLNDNPGPDRSGLFLYLNTSKLGITLDISTPTGSRVFRELVGRADAIVENTAPGTLTRFGVGFRELIDSQPRLVMTSITPFGQTGPYAEFQADDLISFQMSGVGYLTPSEVVTPSEEPPLQAGSRQTDFLAGIAGAVATLHGIFAVDATGEPQHADVSAQEAMAATHFIAFAWLNYEGKETSRQKFEGEVIRHETLLRCKDGYFTMRAGGGQHWQRLVEVMGNPEWSSSDIYTEAASRSDNWHVIEARIEEWAENYTREEIYRAAQANHVPLFPVMSTADLFDSLQLKERNYFTPVTHPETGTLLYPGAPYQMRGTPARICRPAPRLGEHNRDIFVTMLGSSDADYISMAQAGII